MAIAKLCNSFLSPTYGGCVHTPWGRGAEGRLLLLQVDATLTG